VPLFPEHKSLDFLMERKGLYTEGGWEALYQQSLFIEKGGMLPVKRAPAA
jgi:hypothetical protein